MAQSRAVKRPTPAAAPVLRGKRLALAAVGGVALALLLVGLSLVATRGGGKSASTPVVGAADAASLVKGLPQQGFALGAPDAPVTLEEYADIQCPFCKRWALEVMPTVVQQYVRSGKVRVVFRPMAFIGDDSVRAARYVNAASKQNKAWQLLDVLYRNQGVENAGWASEGFVESAAKSVGLDVAKARAYAQSDASMGALRTTSAIAANHGIDSTPSLLMRVRGGQAEQLDAFDTVALANAIDAALA